MKAAEVVLRAEVFLAVVDFTAVVCQEAEVFTAVADLRAAAEDFTVGEFPVAAPLGAADSMVAAGLQVEVAVPEAADGTGKSSIPRLVL